MSQTVIKMYNSELLDNSQFRVALAELLNKPLRGMVSYQLSRIASEIDPDVKTVNETRSKLAIKFSTDGKSVDKDKVAEFQKELQEVLDQQIEVTLPAGKVQLTTEDLQAMDWKPLTFIALDKIFEVK